MGVDPQWRVIVGRESCIVQGAEGIMHDVGRCREAVAVRSSIPSWLVIGIRGSIRDALVLISNKSGRERLRPSRASRCRWIKIG